MLTLVLKRMTKEVRPPKGALVAGGPPRKQDYPLKGSPTATFTKDLPAPGGNGSWAPEKDQTLRPPVLHSEGTGDALSLSSQPKITPLPAVWGEQSEAEERHSGAAREAGPVPRLVACKMHPKPQQRAQALQ